MAVKTYHHHYKTETESGPRLGALYYVIVIVFCIAIAWMISVFGGDIHQAHQ